MSKYPAMQARKYIDLSNSRARRAALGSTHCVTKLLHVEEPEIEWLRSKMFRLHTFEKFQPRQTCCKEDIPDYETGTYVIAELGDEEDRQEIRQEQAEQVEKLESLLLEFEDKYRELGTPVVDFFAGYWHDRMKEIVQEQVRSNEDELQRIGVVLEEAGHASSCSDTEDATLEELGDEDE